MSTYGKGYGLNAYADKDGDSFPFADRLIVSKAINEYFLDCSNSISKAEIYSTFEAEGTKQTENEYRMKFIRSFNILIRLSRNFISDKKLIKFRNVDELKKRLVFSVKDNVSSLEIGEWFDEYTNLLTECGLILPISYEKTDVASYRSY